MIQINDKWAIDIDTYNYVLEKKLKSTLKVKGVEQLDENGNPIPQYQVVGYFGSFGDALRWLGKLYTRDALIDGGNMTLGDAICIVEHSESKLERLIKEAVKE